MKLGSVIFFVMLLATFGGSEAYAQRSLLPHFRSHEKYQTVRVKMIKAGWRPYHTLDADTCDAGDKRCAGRPEMQTCSGIGAAFCTFVWKRNGKTATIQTVGDQTELESSFVR